MHVRSSAPGVDTSRPNGGPGAGRLARAHHRRALTALVLTCIVTLTALRLADAETRADALLLAALVILVAALVVVDFRAAVAIAIFELVLMGAGGQWAQYGGGITGRHVLAASVTAAAAVALLREARAIDARRRDVLGRYGLHALVIAAVFPAVWMTLGVARGNAIADVLGDGNGFVFFAFALVVVVLLRRGEGAWLRRCFLLACSANAVVTAVLAGAALVGAVSLGGTLRTLLLERLDAGGVVGTMPNGAFRLFLGSGLYLQVGLALVTWELLREPRRLWPWVIFVLLWADVIGTYTRGLWIGAILAFVLVLALGSVSWSRAVTVGGATLLLFGVTTIAGMTVGRSLPDYLLSRSATAFGAGEVRARPRLHDAGFEGGAAEFEDSWVAVDSQPRSLTMSLSRPGHSGARSLTLQNSSAGGNDYVAQVIAAQPNTRYVVSAWRKSTTSTVSGNRVGLFVWDPVNGSVVTARPTTVHGGWRQVVMGVQSGPRRSVLQVRLYAPLGRVSWDDVRVARAARPVPLGIHRKVTPRPASAALLAAGAKADVAGDVSNAMRAEQYHVLGRHIRERPLLGSGFGSIAADYPYGTSYSYELSYLDLLFKTGLLGLLLFLSFPLRLVWDALTARWGRRPTPSGVTPPETSVVVAIVLSVLFVGATNPFLFAAFGVLPLVVSIAWLDDRAEGTDS